MLKIKKSQGITLVALIITIIILLILAGITIGQLTGNGLFENTKEAREKYESGQEQENRRLLEYENAIVNIGTGEKVGIIENSNTGNEPEIEEPQENYLELSVLKAGDYVNYDTGVSTVGANGVILCNVLYDPTSNKGLQIASHVGVEEITLGKNDPNVPNSITDDGKKALWSYNNAITYLNTYANNYKNPIYAVDARSIGSKPTVNSSGIFTNKNDENVGPYSFDDIGYTGEELNVKASDENYSEDSTALTNIDQLSIPNNYWFASREVIENYNDRYFMIKFQKETKGDDGTIGNMYVPTGSYMHILKCNLKITGFNPQAGYIRDYDTMVLSAYTGYDIYYLRPVFSLKTTLKISEGDGTRESPYVLVNVD